MLSVKLLPLHLLFFVVTDRATCFSTLLPSSSTARTSLKNPLQFRRLSMASSDNNNNNNDEIMEESRLKILQSRRNSIRSALKYAEEIRTLRLSNGWVPDDDDDKVTDPITGELTSSTSSAGKAALSWTAFGVAAGAVALRFGGRAALVSAIGLDFAKDNPELKVQLDQILSYAHDMNTGLEVLAFVAAWTVVKVFCFDAGGIVLALSSGVLFGGVWQGALASATAATIASATCFFLAKLDTPVRNKALEIVEEYPSLRGIEKVVAQDGFKAILTLRLAPILPIPLGLYNYVYGVTNVPFWDFSAGIFLGSFKPYLLDSYLGYFGMSVVDGSVGDEVGYQDVILLLALGLSVLIGVFASQLAGETWEAVLKEVELERKAKLESLASSEGAAESKDTIATMMDILGVRSQVVDGMPLPEWLVDWQINWGMAEERMMELINVEQKARVWNYTITETTTAQSANSDFSDSQSLPRALNPALQPNAPEVTEVGQGVDLGQSIVEGMVLTPALFSTFLKVADPLYSDATDMEEEEDVEKELRPTFVALAEQRRRRQQQQQQFRRRNSSASNDLGKMTTMMMQEKGRGSDSSSWSATTMASTSSDWKEWSRESSALLFDDRQDVSKRVEMLRTRAQRRLDRLEGILQQLEDSKGGIKK